MARSSRPQRAGGRWSSPPCTRKQLAKEAFSRTTKAGGADARDRAAEAAFGQGDDGFQSSGAAAGQQLGDPGRRGAQSPPPGQPHLPWTHAEALLHPVIAVWSCYLLADWVADLALGLLLNNMGNIGGGSSSSFGLKRGGGGGANAGATAGNDSGGSSSPIIFAFWTPFLLLHLGGPDTINEHLIGLLFELFSACVIFFCSLRSNPTIHATALMFVAGIIKYGERTYSLYCGSLESFRANIDPGPPRTRSQLRQAEMTKFDSKEKAGLPVEIAIDSSREAEDARRDAEQVEVVRMVADDRSVEARAYDFFSIFRRLFVDLILSPKQRRKSQAFFPDSQDVSAATAFEIVELELGFIYDMMVYTKSPVAHTWGGSVCSACIVSAQWRPIGETLSEYMLYLLIKQPEMLSARTGIWLMRYQDTCAEAQRFFGSMPGCGWRCCYTRRASARAARTRGGELITVIWLLMEHMGLGNAMHETNKGGAVAKLIVHDH